MKQKTILEVELDPVSIYLKGKWHVRYVPMNMSNQRMHWAVKSQWTNGWKISVFTAFCIVNRMASTHFLTFTNLKKKINVEVIFKNIRPMDRDGAYHAAKPVVDGLVYAGIIKDDSEEFINLKVKQVKVKTLKDQKTLIKLSQ